MTKILVIDDDKDLLHLLQLLLKKDNYEVDTAVNGDEGLKKAFEQRPNLILLDIMMSAMNGYETCSRLKLLTNTPIIMLTARSDENSLVRGLDCGADDYVVKPCDYNILLAKIKALLRRAKTVPPIKTTYSDNYLSIALIDGKVLANGQDVRLTSTEFKLLAYLFKNANRVVPHEEIIRAIWGNHSPTDKRSLKLYMLYLRRKIEKDPNRPVYLKTIWGVGYQFQYQIQPGEDMIVEQLEA